MAIESGYADSAFLQSDFIHPNNFDFEFEDNPNIKYQLRSITLPFRKLATSTSRSGNKYYSAITFIESVSMTFFETTDLKVMSYFKNWFDTIFDEKTNRFIANQTTKNGILTIYKSAENGTKALLIDEGGVQKIITIPVFKDVNAIRFKYTGLRPLSFEDLTLNYETTDTLTLSVALTLDSIDPEI